VTGFVGEGRSGGSFDGCAEFSMDCQDSSRSTMYRIASMSICFISITPRGRPPQYMF
jgi:hypothetical protein